MRGGNSERVAEHDSRAFSVSVAIIVAVAREHTDAHARRCDQR